MAINSKKDIRKKVFKKIFIQPCPICHGTNIKVERNRAPVVVNGALFGALLPNKFPKVIVYKCRDCHTLWQSDGYQITVSDEDEIMIKKMEV